MEAAIVTNLSLGMKMFNVVSVGPIMLQLSENPLMIGLGFTNQCLYLGSPMCPATMDSTTGFVG
jgi:hypothetical protein